MDFYSSALAEKSRLVSLTERYSKALDRLPEGSLSVTKNGDYVKNYLVKNGERIYLPASQKTLVEDLAKRKYLEAEVQDAQAEIHAIDYYLRHHKSFSYSEKLLHQDALISGLLSRLLLPDEERFQKWASEDYPKYDGFPEKLIHRGPFGQMFRSKTEADIAFLLTRYRIPYRYEMIREINGTVYPIDFTTRHPKDGSLIYWEHFGIIDKLAYAAKIGPMLNDYESAGIFPEINLILTFESRRFPINSTQLEEVIRRWYL